MCRVYTSRGEKFVRLCQKYLESVPGVFNEANPPVPGAFWHRRNQSWLVPNGQVETADNPTGFTKHHYKKT